MTTRSPPPSSDKSNTQGGAPTLEAAHKQLQAQYNEVVERLQQLELEHINAAQQPAAQQQPAPPQGQNVPPENHNHVDEVNVVRNLKIPPFWRENPMLWFAQVEATFALNNINGDATRYRHVITQLDSQTLPAIADIIVNPPPAEKYLAIKNRIVSSFAETTESKLRKLLRGLDPSNDKPTLLLQRIRNLADGQVGDALLRTLFLEQLPEYVRGVLVISGDLDLSALAQQADKVMEATHSTNVSAVHTVKSQNDVSAVSRDSAISELLSAVTVLAKEVKTLKSEVRSRSRSSSRSRATSADNSASGNICFYHAKFGAEARKCQKPCAMASQQGN